MHNVPTTDYAGNDQRWNAIVRRDPIAENAFLYAVRTTGIYCRPTCSARRPKRANVRFFNDWEDAERAGFRACKKCHPKETHHAVPPPAVLAACRMIESAEVPLSLNELAEGVGLSPYHFHRLFKKWVGVTPKAYASEVRSRRFEQNLHTHNTVTSAIYDAGYGSSSRCYENVSARIGMNPREYSNGAANLEIRFAMALSDLGWVLVAGTRRGVCAVELGDTPDDVRDSLAVRFPKANLVGDDPGMQTWLSGVLQRIQSPAPSNSV